MRRIMLAVVIAGMTASLVCVTVIGQPAPQPPKKLIMGVKTTEPLTVLEKGFRTNLSDIGRALGPIVGEVFGAAAEAGINVLPNRATTVVRGSPQELLQGMVEEVECAFRVPVVDDLDPGELPGHPGIKIVRVEPQLVGYTYGVGDPGSVAEQRTPLLMAWLMGQGHWPTGPFYLSVFQDPNQIGPGGAVCEVQLGLKKPEAPAARP